MEMNEALPDSPIAGNSYQSPITESLKKQHKATRLKINVSNDKCISRAEKLIKRFLFMLDETPSKIHEEEDGDRPLSRNFFRCIIIL